MTQNCFDCTKRHGTKCDIGINFTEFSMFTDIKDLKNWGFKCGRYKGYEIFMFR